MKRLIATVVALLFLLPAGATPALAKAKALASADPKVTLCHAAPPDQHKKYVQITVAAAGAYNGHYSQHDDDIIPPFTYKGKTYSKNWTAEGQAVFNNGCQIPAQPSPSPSPTGKPSPKPTVSPLPSPKPSPHHKKAPKKGPKHRATHPVSSAQMPFTGLDWQTTVKLIAFAITLILVGFCLTVMYKDFRKNG